MQQNPVTTSPPQSSMGAAKARATDGLRRFIREDNTVRRALKWTIALDAAIASVLFFCHLRPWSLGFALGGSISVFSLVTLLGIVPLVFAPGRSPKARGLLSLTFFMKIPIYAALLAAANRAHGVEPLAAAAGIALAPMVLTFQSLATVLREAAAESRTPKSADAGTPEAVTKAPGFASRPTTTGQPLHEGI